MKTLGMLTVAVGLVLALCVSPAKAQDDVPELLSTYNLGTGGFAAFVADVHPTPGNEVVVSTVDGCVILSAQDGILKKVAGISNPTGFSGTSWTPAFDYDGDGFPELSTSGTDINTNEGKIVVSTYDHVLKVLSSGSEYYETSSPIAAGLFNGQIVSVANFGSSTMVYTGADFTKQNGWPVLSSSGIPLSLDFVGFSKQGLYLSGGVNFYHVDLDGTQLAPRFRLPGTGIKFSNGASFNLDASGNHVGFVGAVDGDVFAVYPDSSSGVKLYESKSGSSYTAFRYGSADKPLFMSADGSKLISIDAIKRSVTEIETDLPGVGMGPIVGIFDASGKQYAACSDRNGLHFINITTGKEAPWSLGFRDSSAAYTGLPDAVGKVTNDNVDDLVVVGSYAVGLYGLKPSDVPTAVEDLESVIPKGFELGNAYPNPFNPITTIPYQVPFASKIEMKIFDPLGQLVRTLVERELSAGSYMAAWDGRDNNGNMVSSGLYFYRLEGFDDAHQAVFAASGKVTLTK